MVAVVHPLVILISNCGNRGSCGSIGIIALVAVVCSCFSSCLAIVIFILAM